MKKCGGWWALFLFACADPVELTQEPDASPQDSGVIVDGGFGPDLGTPDSGAPRDVGPTDQGFEDRGVAFDAEPADAEPADAEPADVDPPDLGTPDTGTSSVSWSPTTFTSTTGESACSGSSFVRWLPSYQKWVAVILCTPDRYKIFMGEDAAGPFHSIGDFAGNGQDHCELVNPAFTIPNEDDITSGGCTTCALGPFINPVGSRGYSRARFGDPFTYEPVWPMFNLYTPTWYQCGVNLP